MAGFESQTKRMPGFPGGVNNVFREDSLPDEQLRKAVNVDLLPGGKLRRRSGYTRRLDLSDARSGAYFLGSLYLANQGDFIRVDLNDYSTDVIANVSPVAYLSYAEQAGNLFVSDGVSQAFRVTSAGDVVSWSSEQPSGQPSLASDSPGGLPEGMYQVAITYLRGSEESGTTQAAEVTLSSPGKIEVTDIPAPADPSITHVRVYVSHTNGEVLYAHSKLAPGVSSFSISSLPAGKALETQFLDPLPAGHIVAAYKGRIFTAVGHDLWYSEPFRYGLCRVSQNFISFDSRVNMVRPVESGIYIGTEKRTIFLSGPSPMEFRVLGVHYAGVIEGTDTSVPSSVFAFDSLNTGNVAVWWSKSGSFIVGLASGQVIPLRDGELAVPDFVRGNTMLREKDGVRSIVSVLQQPMSDHSALVSHDQVTAEVHRNGITI